MNVRVAYYSRFGNTERLAEEVGRIFRSAGLESQVVGIEELSQHIEGSDLLVVGSPTHKINLPGDVRDLLKSLPRGMLGSMHFAAFDTSYRMNWLLSRFAASRRLDKTLRRLGGKSIAVPETFYVVNREGPLCEGEFERAGKWALEILKHSEIGAELGGLIRGSISDGPRGSEIRRIG